MVNIFKKISAVIENTCKFTAVISGAMIVLMAFIITYSVVMRYVFKNPDSHTYDLASIILLWSVVLTIPWLEKLDQHIRMDMVVNFIPRLTRYVVLRIIGPALALFYAIILAWKGWVNFIYSYNIGELSTSPWALPLAPVKFVVPVGYCLLGLMLLLNLVRGIAGFRNAGKTDIPSQSTVSGNEVRVEE